MEDITPMIFKIAELEEINQELLDSCKGMIDFLKLPMDLRAEGDLKAIIVNMNEVIKRAESYQREQS